MNIMVMVILLMINTLLYVIGNGILLTEIMLALGNITKRVTLVTIDTCLIV